jgi:Zn-dependent peptidase ImmA (M78 family)
MTDLKEKETAPNKDQPARERLAAPHPAQRVVIKRLRRLIPAHDGPLSWLAAERIAAAQGTKLAQLAEQTNLDPAAFIGSLPVVRVETDENLPDLRASYWDENAQQWVILVRTAETPAERRFNVVHQFKRILDRGHETQLYDPRYLHGHVQAEMAADYFASCALMPARKVRTALKNSTTATGVAKHFHVARPLALRRLSDLNLRTTTKHPERRQSP